MQPLQDVSRAARSITGDNLGLTASLTPKIALGKDDNVYVTWQDTRFATTASLKGDSKKGHAHFTALCAGCHRLRGEGNEVGPDLNMVASKPVDWMLHAILDPSQAIEARYRAWTLQVDGGEPLSGIIAAETANNLVLRYAGNPEVPVLRSQIQSMTPMKESLMPAGFESALQPQDMADLLTWIRGE